MTEVLAKANLASFEQSAVEPISNDLGVMEIRGEIGKSGPVSVKAVRKSLSALSDAERLHLVISSEGGEVDEAYRIYSLFRSLPLPISAEVRGKCQSAAVMILIAADFRWSRRDARILIHRSRTESKKLFSDNFVTAPQLLAAARHLFETDDREVDLLALRTGYDRSWFEREQANEDLMQPMDAVRCGLLHAIEGKVPFSTENLAVLDGWSLDYPKPSQKLAANYRAAGRVAALCCGTNSHPDHNGGDI